MIDELPAEAKLQVKRVGDRSLYLSLELGQARGWGECSPLPNRSLESVSDCQTALDRLVGNRELLPLPPAARFAVETAWLDCTAQLRGCSVADVLAEPVVEALSTSRVVHVSAAAPPPGTESTWKIKMGTGAFHREYDQLVTLRTLAPGGRFRLDVNRHWPHERVAEYLERVAVLTPEWVEEPASAERLLSGPRPPCSIAVDESLIDAPEATAELLALGWAKIVVIKPALLGSYQRALEWSRTARNHGAIPIISHLFDGPIALAAYAELARALAMPGDPAPGLGMHKGLGALPPVAIFQLAAGGLRSHRPGLGLAP